MTTYIDLSIAIENDVVADPVGFGPSVTYVDHVAGAKQLVGPFPGLETSQLPDEEGWAVELIRLSTHNGTHMDAPWHFHSTQDAITETGKRPAMTIDELPLDWCLRPGVKLDFRHLPDGYVATAADVDAELIGSATPWRPSISWWSTSPPAPPMDRPLRRHRMRCRPRGHPSSGQPGVKIVGTDATGSWDAPFVHTNKVWQETRDPSIIWEGHKAGREIGYFQMEKLHNLEQLPSTGFRISCFPVKIKAASAGWIRAVGIID